MNVHPCRLHQHFSELLNGFGTAYRGFETGPAVGNGCNNVEVGQNVVWLVQQAVVVGGAVVIVVVVVASGRRRRRRRRRQKLGNKIIRNLVLTNGPVQPTVLHPKGQIGQLVDGIIAKSRHHSQTPSRVAIIVLGWSVLNALQPSNCEPKTRKATARNTNAVGARMTT